MKDGIGDRRETATWLSDRHRMRCLKSSARFRLERALVVQPLRDRFDTRD